MAHPLINGLPQYVCAEGIVAGERDPDRPEEEDVPETPPDEPKPVPVQDPPAEPSTPPYVVGREDSRQQFKIRGEGRE
jgi:hypothetical protein